jgi:hypothetical protein
VGVGWLFGQSLIGVNGMKVSTMFNQDFHDVSLNGHEDQEQLVCVGPEEILMLEQEFDDPEDALDSMRSSNIHIW